MHDERSTRVEAQPITHDYSRRRGVVHAEIVLPPGAVDWARDRQKLWNAAEHAERRKDSCVAREFECSLPHELSDRQRVELAREITAELVSRYGFGADFAVHRPNLFKGDDPRNHHVHILCTTRVLGADGLGEKTRVLDSAKTGSDEIRWAREMVGLRCNAALARAGIDASVDHRSLVDQRIAALAEGDDESAAVLDRPATKHRGPIVTAIVKDERESYVEERIQDEIADEIEAIGQRQAAESAVAGDIDALDQELDALRTEIGSVEQQVAEALQEIADDQLRSSELTHVEQPRPRPRLVVPEREREIRKTALAFIAPTPALVSIDETEAKLAEAEALLAAAEALQRQREHERRQALQREQSARRALETAKEGLWARLRAAVGFSPPAAVLVAQQTAQAASAAAVSLLQAQRQAFGLAPVKTGFMSKLDASTMVSELVASERASTAALAAQVGELRSQLAGLRLEDVEKRRQEVAAVAEVVALVVRLDAAVAAGDPRRQAWRTLVMIDRHGLIDPNAVDPYARLALVLTKQPQVRQQVVAEIASRLPELETLEDELLRLVDDDQAADDDGNWPTPGNSELSGTGSGLAAAIEHGPVKAGAEHWAGWLGGCEQRGEISSDELEQAIQVLIDLPEGSIEREQLLRLVLDQSQGSDLLTTEPDTPMAVASELEAIEREITSDEDQDQDWAPPAM